MRFKTGELVKDRESHVSAVIDVPDDMVGPFIAVRHRAFNSSSVYFGPFATLDDLTKWCDEHNLSVSIISLTDPSSDSSAWWHK